MLVTDSEQSAEWPIIGPVPRSGSGIFPHQVSLTSLLCSHDVLRCPIIISHTINLGEHAYVAL